MRVFEFARFGNRKNKKITLVVGKVVNVSVGLLVLWDSETKWKMKWEIFHAQYGKFNFNEVRMFL